MFKSETYTYDDLFTMIKNEVESYKAVPDDILYLACNTEMQYLYSQVIKKQIMATGEFDSNAGIATNVSVPGGVTIPFEDIVTVRANGENFMYTLPKNAHAYENTYYEGADGEIRVVTKETLRGEIEIYYNYRPVEINKNTKVNKVELPTEYIPMLLSAIRTEAYKYIHQDDMSAKWAADYNAYREGFDKWVESTRPTFG
ncbi:MAG: hypothetical protein IKU60_03765 [Clostridia bacterium]|nr:hypothetical protein [Clostridia bacterium]